MAKLGLLGRALVGAIGGAAAGNVQRLGEEREDKRSRALADYQHKYALDLEAIQAQRHKITTGLQEEQIKVTAEGNKAEAACREAAAVRDAEAFIATQNYREAANKYRTASENAAILRDYADNKRDEKRWQAAYDQAERQAEAAERRHKESMQRLKNQENKAQSPVGRLQADVDSGLITQKLMDEALAQQYQGQSMLEFKRRLDAAKALALADPTSYRRDKHGEPQYTALDEAPPIDPDAYGKNYNKFLEKLQSGELGGATASPASAGTALPVEPATSPESPYVAPTAAGVSRGLQGYTATTMQAVKENGESFEEGFEFTAKNGDVLRNVRGFWHKKN